VRGAQEDGLLGAAAGPEHTPELEDSQS
jgi:hypothetical protein